MVSDFSFATYFNALSIALVKPLMMLGFFSIKLFLALYAVYGTSPPSAPKYATLYPRFCFSNSSALGSLNVMIWEL